MDCTQLYTKHRLISLSKLAVKNEQECKKLSNEDLKGSKDIDGAKVKKLGECKVLQSKLWYKNFLTLCNVKRLGISQSTQECLEKDTALIISSPHEEIEVKNTHADAEFEENDDDDFNDDDFNDDDFNDDEDDNNGDWDDITIDTDNLEIGTINYNNNNNNGKVLTVNVSNPKLVSQSLKPKNDTFPPAYAIIYRDSDLILTNKTLAISRDKICKCIIGYFILNNINPTNVASIVTKYIINDKKNNDHNQISIIQTQCSQEFHDRYHHNVSRWHSNTNPLRKLFFLDMAMTTETRNNNNNINNDNSGINTYVWNERHQTYLQLNSQTKNCGELSHEHNISRSRSPQCYWIQCGLIGFRRMKNFDDCELLQRFFKYFQKSRKDEFDKSRLDITNIFNTTEDNKGMIYWLYDHDGNLNLEYGKNVDAFWMTNYYYPNSHFGNDAGACEIGHNARVTARTTIAMSSSVLFNKYHQYMSNKVLRYGDWIEMSIDVSHKYPFLCFYKNNGQRSRNALITSCNLKDAQPNDFLYIPFFCVACDCGFKEGYFSYKLSIE